MQQRLSVPERVYLRRHLSCVRHITLDPKGPGVVRLHLIPPRPGHEKEPFLLLLNGAQLLPVSTGWAILLANFMDALQPSEGTRSRPRSGRRPPTAPPPPRTASTCARPLPSCAAIWRACWPHWRTWRAAASPTNPWAC